MKLSNEAKIGILFVAAVIALGILTMKTGNFKLHHKGYNITILFDNVDGVSVNAPVMLNGLELGVVKAIDIVDKPEGVKMKLSVWLQEEAKMHEGAAAYVKNMGFMGEKYIGLSSGDPEKEYIGEGAILTGTEPVDLDKILLNGQIVTEQIKGITGTIEENVTKNSESIDRIIKGMDSTMTKLSSITERIDKRLEVNAEGIDSMISNLQSTSKNLDLMTQDLKNNPWKLLHRSKEKKE